jgi:hypothetical protein
MSAKPICSIETSLSVRPPFSRNNESSRCGGMPRDGIATFMPLRSLKSLYLPPSTCFLATSSDV